MRKFLLITLIFTLLASISLGVTAMASNDKSKSIQKVTMLAPCDSINEFSEGNREGMVNPEIVTEGGRTYFSATTKGSKQVSLLAKTFDPIDLSKIDRSKVYFQFSIWVEDANAISSAGSIEITSSGRNDAEEISWEFNSSRCANQKLESGKWNDVSIQIGDGATRYGVIDFSRVNFFRIYCFTTKEMKIAYDNFRITYVDAMDMPTVFNAQTAKSFTASNATISGGENSATVTLKSGNASFATTAFEKSTPMAALGLVNLKYSTNEPSKISSAKVTLVTDGGSVSYNVPVGAEVDFSKKFTEYDSLNGASTNFANVTEFKVEFVTTAQTQITVYKACTDTITNLLVREIEELGDVTLENYTQKADQIVWISQAAISLREETGINETYLTQYAYNYLGFTIQKKKYEYLCACQENGIYMNAYIPKKDYKNGDILNVVVELKNLTNEYRNDSWSIDFDEWYLSAQSATAGKINLGANKTRTIEIPFVVKQGGFTWVTAKTVSTLEKTLACEDYAIINDKGLFLGDSHTHSIQSDGINALEDNFYTAFSQWKIAFIYATDHNATPSVTTDIDYAKKVLEAAGLEDFITIKGTEITGLVANVPGYNYSLAGHALYYNGDTFYEEPIYQDLESNVYKWNVITDRIKKEGGYFFMAHPRQGQYRFAILGEDITRVDVFPDITGLEIFNGWQYAGGYSQWDWSNEAIEYWDRINITGRKKYFAIGNSDAHNKVDLTNSYTGYVLNDYSEVSIQNAFGSGNMYASSGVDLMYTLDGVDMGGTVFADQTKEVTLKVSARDNKQTIKKIKLISYAINYSSKPEDSNAGYATREEVILYDNQSSNDYSVDVVKQITVEKGRFYRIEATSTSDEEFAKTSGKVVVRYACSNPIWVEKKASSVTLSADKVKLNVGDEYVLFVNETDSLYDTVKYTSSSDKVQVEVNGKITILEGAEDGTYTITAKTSSGSVTKTVSVVIGEENSETNSTTSNTNEPPKKKKGCKGSMYGASGAFFAISLAATVICNLKRKKA